MVRCRGPNGSFELPRNSKQTLQATTLTEQLQFGAREATGVRLLAPREPSFLLLQSLTAARRYGKRQTPGLCLHDSKEQNGARWKLGIGFAELAKRSQRL